MNVYGIIGKPLAHSRSQEYFTRKFAADGIAESVYIKFEIDDIATLPQIIDNNPDLKGFNVTIPYKQEVIKYLDRIDEKAEQIGAVNCVKVTDGHLTGYNTDYGGFHTSLTQTFGDLKGEGALVLGTGGASKAVVSVLNDLGLDIIRVSRSEGKGDATYGQIDQSMLDSHRLVVNCTPLGTWPETDRKVELPYELLNEHNMLFDLVYNPPLTAFLREGQLHDCRIRNGLEMFMVQAELSWNIFNSIGSNNNLSKLNQPRR